MEKPTIHELETLLESEGRHASIAPDGAVRRHVESALAYLRDADGCLNQAANGDASMIAAARYKVEEARRALSNLPPSEDSGA